MNVLAGVAVLSVACGPGLGADRQVHERTLSSVAAELSDATTSHDVEKVRKLLRTSVVNGGLLFLDVACMKQFAFPGEVPAPRFDAFAYCLATLDLKVSARSNALPDVAVLTYGPGIEIEARFMDYGAGPRLAWIGYTGRRNEGDALPTIDARTLESLRVAGDRHGPVTSTSGLETDLSTLSVAYAWLKVCIDSEGAITGTHVREASSPQAARVFATAARDWQFRAFLVRGQPMPVCSMVQMVYPPEKAPANARLPLPLPPTDQELMMVPPEMMKRVGGQAWVLPDEYTIREMRSTRSERVISSIQYCVDGEGRVSQVQLLRSTGFATYDQRLISAIRGWVFRPFIDEGRAVPVCSASTFVFTQSQIDMRDRPGSELQDYAPLNHTPSRWN